MKGDTYAMEPEEYARRIANGARKIAKLADEGEVGLNTWWTFLGEALDQFRDFSTTWPEQSDTRYK